MKETTSHPSRAQSNAPEPRQPLHDAQPTWELLQSVIDSSPDWIFVKDLDHRFLLVNRSFAASQGLEPRDMTGHLDSEFWSEELCEGNPAKGIRGFHADDREAFRGNLVRNENDPATVRDGTVRIFDTWKGPLRRPDGGIYGVLCYCRDVSERRQVEQALRDAQEQLETRVAERTRELALANRKLEQDLVERQAIEEERRELALALAHAMPGIARVSPDGRYTHVNEVYAQMLGWTPDELLGQPWEPTVHPDDRVAAAAAWHRMREAGKGEFEARALRRDGTLFFKAVLMVARTDREGQFIGHHCFMRDVSERKTAEEAIRRSEQWLQAIVEGTSDAVFLKDREGRYLLFNRAAAGFVGRSAAEVLGHDDRFIFENDEAVGVMTRDRAVMDSAQTVSYEDPVTTADGVTRTFLSTKGPVFDQQGKVSGLFGISRDITERKRTEQALQEAELLYRTIFEQAGAGVARIDSRTGRFLQVNRKYCEILDMTEAEMLGTTVVSMTHPEDVAADLAAVDQLLKGTIPSFMLEKRQFRRDGAVVWLRSNVAPLWRPGEEPTSHIAIVEDITEHKNTQERLLQAQKMEAVGTLTGGIAHDFNNILTPILSFAGQALHQLPEGNPIRADLQQVLTAARRAKSLVQQLLALSRKDTGSVVPLSLAALLDESLPLLRASLPTTIALRLDMRATHSRILGNATQIQQVLLNLCSNAEHAMRETGGTLELWLDEVAVDDGFAKANPPLAPGPHVRLGVRDTGCGIAPEILPRIFDPFFTTKGANEGSGLGLAMAHGIVTGHRGIIRVTSRPGRGTTAEVYLPTDRGTEEPAPPPEEPLATGTARILFVDDEPMIVQLGESLLGMLGYRVTALSDSRRALETFRAAPEQFDLVVTDQTMPGLSGSELAEQLLRLRPDLPIILCSGYSRLMTVEKAAALGIGALLNKPYEMEELSATVRRVLSGSTDGPAVPSRER